MSIDFYPAHIETLSELKLLADKHNCKLSFGTRSHSMQLDDIDKDYLIKHFDCPEDIAEEIYDGCSFEYYNGGEESYVYFELRDHRDEKHVKYNILEKTICENSFVIHIDEYKSIPECGFSKKALRWLQGHSVNSEWGEDDDSGFIMIDRYENEDVHGFEGVTKEGWCYRTGMILAVFTQLVCDYLGEERIKRTY